MSLLQKTSRTQSSRYQIQIKSVKDGVLELPNQEYRVILEVTSINFELMSIEEQDGIIKTFMQLLGSMNFPIQILQRARELDLDDYIANYSKRLDIEQNPIYREQIEGYIEFVSELVKTNKILSRQFLIVIPLKAKKGDNFDLIKERLNSRLKIVEGGLENMGIASKMFASDEILNLFSSFYNPDMMKRQPITDKTLQLLYENYL